MKLFKHLGLHGAPKSSVIYTVEYLLATDEAIVFDHLDKCHHWIEWHDPESDEYDPENHGGMTYGEWLMSIRGPMHNEDLSWDNAYYGVKEFGWSEGTEISLEDAAVLIRLGIAKQL